MLAKDFTIIYLGSPEFAIPPLDALIKAGYNIPLVVSQPDKVKGRKKVLTPTPVKAAAIEHGIPVITPDNINTPEIIAQLEACKPDLLVVTAFGQILKKPLLELATFGAVNIHASILPEYRGAAPIHRAIMDGQTITGVTTMFMDIGLDTGDMILQETVEILEQDTTGTLRDKMATVGSRLILDTVNLIMDDIAPRQPQNHEYSTYAKKITREDEKIIWHKEALVIHNLIRGLVPDTSGCTTYEDDQGTKDMKIWRSELTGNQATAKPGTVLGHDKAGILVATGDQVLRLLEIQPAGKSMMKAVDWWRGQEKNYQDKPLIFH